MQVEKLDAGKRYEIADRAVLNLTLKGAERRPGWCQRWVKQVLIAVGASQTLRCEGAESAREAFEWYVAMEMVMPEGTPPNIGDILYKVRPKDGLFGHVGIYIGRGKVAENSSAHWNGRHPDARGVRDISNYPGHRVVRIWR